MNLRVLNFLLVVIPICFPNSAIAQQFQGMVFSEKGKPILGVSVFLNSEEISKTNNLGIFQLPDYIVFPLDLRLEHPDYFLKEVEMVRENQRFQLSPFNKNEELDAIFISSANVSKAENKDGNLFPTEKIKAAKFEAHSPMDLVSAINETPGVLIQSGAINTNRITIRGVGSRTLYGTNKIRSYFNGIPITNGVGETAIDIFDPENLQLVEIIKGPKAPHYGSNLGGTLLPTTKMAEPGETFFKTNVTVGAYNFIKNMLSFDTASDKFSLNVNYDFMKTDGFRENSNYERNTLLINSKYKVGTKNEVSFLMNYSDYRAQIPSSIGLSQFLENPSEAAFTWKQAQGFEKSRQVLAGVQLTHNFSKKISNTTTGFFSFMDNYEPRPFNILDETTAGYGGRTVFSAALPAMGRTIDLIFGAEIFRDGYNWSTIENRYEENNGNGSLEGAQLSKNFEERNNFDAFASATIAFTKRLEGQFGLNFHKTHYSFKDEFNTGAQNKSATRNFEPILAPNINLMYRFTDNLNAFFNISRGFNYPSIEETLTPEGVINLDIGPEKGFNYEVGSALYLFDRKFHIQVNAYLLDINDLLVADRTGNDEYIGRNAGQTEHKGIEIQLSFKQPIHPNGYIAPYLNADFSKHKFIDFVDGNNDFSGNQLTGVPDRKFVGGIDLKLKKFHLNTNFLYAGETPLNDANSLFAEDYAVLNAKASYRFHFSQRLQMEVNAGVNNITNEKYAASVLINASGFGNAEPRYYYPGMPRNWYSGFKLNYNLL